MFFCDCISKRVGVLKRHLKRRKSLKMANVWVVFGFCGGLVVVLWWECKWFGELKSIICDIDE